MGWGEGGALSVGGQNHESLEKSGVVEQRQSVGWICWARGGMEENGAREEGEA